jgi:glutamine synthetase adenylyltransferase
MSAGHDRIARRVLAEAADGRELEALFAELRFADPAKAAALWRRLVPPGGAEAPPPENIANLLAELASSPDPDMALLNLARFVEAKIAPARFLHSLFLARPIARLIVTIFSCSYFLTSILERNPGYLSWLIEPGTLEGTKAHSAYLFELSRQIEPFRDRRRRINSVKRYFRREMLRVGARDLMGLARVEEVTAELSFLADAIIETVASMAFEELAVSAGPGDTAWSFDASVPFHRFGSGPTATAAPSS